MRLTASLLKSLPPGEAEELLSNLTPEQKAAKFYDWNFWARDEQLIPPPRSGEHGDWIFWVYLAGRGTGKALALDTPIPTPTGWAKMGNLRSGDAVFDETGAQCRVLAAHPVQIGRRCYRVQFSDGSAIVADEDHLWTTVDRRMRKALRRRSGVVSSKPQCQPRHFPRTLTTRQIAATLYDDGEVNHAIPCAGPLECAEAALPVDPYLFGCWLGDGSSSCAEITTADHEILSAFEASGLTAKGIKGNCGAATRYYLSAASGSVRCATTGQFVANGDALHSKLRTLGVIRNKHIPSIYLRASAQQRTALLQGLMDTDGHCCRRNGTSEFCSTNAQIAHGVHELAISLGLKAVMAEGRANLKGRDCGPRYRVTFTAHSDTPVFRLSRKASAQRQRGDQSSKVHRRYIVAVKPVPSVPVRCITVDSQSRLYLAGRAMVPTHNTRTGAEAAREWVRQGYTFVNLIGATAEDVRAIMIDGEALALDTEVATPNGFRPIGDLAAGDLVIGGDGKPCRVINAFPVLHGRPCYRLKIRNGAEIVADANHKWLTEAFNDRAATTRNGTPRPSVRTTREISETVWYEGPGNRQRNHGIRVASIDGVTTDLPIDPYVLGAWLGDGATKCGDFTTADQEVLAHFISAGFRISERSSNGTQGLARTYGILGLQKRLRLAGLLRNKHVPDAYFRAPREARLAVVQGLMDTDGSISERGQCDFVNANEGLTLALAELLNSLGIKCPSPASRVASSGRLHWRISFTTTHPVFRLTRKLERLPKRGGYCDFFYIDSVDQVSSVAVRCIEVDSPDHTFLITRQFIRTHNSGIMNICPNEERPRYLANQKTLRWPNGAVSLVFSAEEPDRMRGKQHMKLWCDELAAWRYADAWDQAIFGLRLGAKPQALVTTTPRPTKLVRALVADPKAHIVRGTTYDNVANLSPDFTKRILEKYEGTRIGRQELLAQILEDNPGALWNRDMLDRDRVAPGDVPSLQRVVISIDPAISSSEKSNETGIVAVGRAENGHCFLLDDRSGVMKPSAWAEIAVGMYRQRSADRVVAEVNQGGEMVESTIRSFDSSVAYKGVHASRGKVVRAEPVAALYERGMVHHVGSFAKLEDQMCLFTSQLDRSPDGSPDRVDATVWAITDLALQPTTTGFLDYMAELVKGMKAN